MARQKGTQKTKDGLVDIAPKLIAKGDFAQVARIGAAHGAAYLREEILNGKSNDDASFLPEVYVYKDGKLAGVVAIAGNHKPGEVADAIGAVVMEAFKSSSEAVVTVTAGWLSRKASAKRRPRHQADRITASFSIVYTAPDKIVAYQALPIGTAEDVKRAGHGVVVDVPRKAA